MNYVTSIFFTVLLNKVKTLAHSQCMRRSEAFRDLIPVVVFAGTVP